MDHFTLLLDKFWSQSGCRDRYSRTIVLGEGLVPALLHRIGSRSVGRAADPTSSPVLLLHGHPRYYEMLTYSTR